MEVLNQHGQVSLTAPLTVTGTKKTGRQISVSDETVELRDTRLKRYLGLILKRIDRKAGPKYSSVHYLVITFDDILGFRKAEELTQLQTALEHSASLSKLHFKTLILLGSPDETFLAFQLSE